MNVEECINAAELEAAYEALQKAVHDTPENVELQALLFELLSIMGNWQQALMQLNKLTGLSEESFLSVQTYRGLVKAETARNEVFSGRRDPLFFAEGHDWLDALINSLEPAVYVHGSEPHERILSALEQAAPRSGSIDDQSFSWISDADMRLGPVFEIMCNGKYYWAPFDIVSEITFSEPLYLRDLVWLPVAIRWANNQDCVGFMPSRYPGLATVSDPQSALARKTDWTDRGDHFYIGSGQRMFTTENAEYPLLQIRKIVFETSVDPNPVRTSEA